MRIPLKDTLKGAAFIVPLAIVLAYFGAVALVHFLTADPVGSSFTVYYLL